jgi:hypothetical protein
MVYCSSFHYDMSLSELKSKDDTLNSHNHIYQMVY